MEEIKRKRGRPPKALQAGDTVKPTADGKITKCKKNDPNKIGGIIDSSTSTAIKLFNSSVVRIGNSSPRHTLESIVDYIDKYSNKSAKSHILAQAALRKISPRYYIYLNLINFFNIDDKSFDGETLK